MNFIRLQLPGSGPTFRWRMYQLIVDDVLALWTRRRICIRCRAIHTTYNACSSTCHFFQQPINSNNHFHSDCVITEVHNLLSLFERRAKTKKTMQTFIHHFFSQINNESFALLCVDCHILFLSVFTEIVWRKVIHHFVPGHFCKSSKLTCQLRSCISQKSIDNRNTLYHCNGRNLQYYALI